LCLFTQIKRIQSREVEMSNINVANINFNKITRICFYFTDMFGKEAIKLITELDMHEDVRPFNVSTNIIQILLYYRLQS